MITNKLKYTTIREHDFARKNSRNSLGGFTIVELMIATTVFSVILLLATFALLQVGRTYYKGITLTKTQNVARSIMDTISQDIQFSGDLVTIPDPSSYPPDPPDTHASDPYAICIGNHRYSVKLDQKVSGTATHALVYDANIIGCLTAASGYMDAALTDPNSKELLDPNMRIAKLTVTNTPTNLDLYTINLIVVYGDNDLLNEDTTSPNPNYHKQCLSVQAGTQFCAVVSLSTTVQKRINSSGT